MSKKKISRSAITGRFVKKSYAKKHPRTTKTETVRVPPRGTAESGPKRRTGHTGPRMR